MHSKLDCFWVRSVSAGQSHCCSTSNVACIGQYGNLKDWLVSLQQVQFPAPECNKHMGSVSISCSSLSHVEMTLNYLYVICTHELASMIDQLMTEHDVYIHTNLTALLHSGQCVVAPCYCLSGFWHLWRFGYQYYNTGIVIALVILFWDEQTDPLSAPNKTFPKHWLQLQSQQQAIQIVPNSNFNLISEVREKLSKVGITLYMQYCSGSWSNLTCSYHAKFSVSLHSQIACADFSYPALS